MIQLDLTEEEQKTLIDILRADLSDLRMEIAHTDRLGFREMLKQRKAAIRKLLDALQQQGPVAD